MSDLWTFDAFAAALAGNVTGDAPSAVTGISIDTRTLQPGDAFFAIKGDRFDGHDYVDAALAAGASVAVVSRCTNAAGCTVEVDDVLRALERLAVAARARTDATVIAVTGSVGKTSVKEMLRAALWEEGAVHAATASFNNHWGVPLTLARMPAETDYAVCEIGMNHAGEITPLTGMVRPHVAVVTTVEAVHIEFFPNVEAIADAKAEIFSGLEPGGAAILNRDNPHFERLRGAAEAKAARIVTFGQDLAADVHLNNVAATPLGADVTWTQAGETFSAAFGLRGTHMAVNAMAVLAACEAASVPPQRVAPRLAEMTPAPGRGERTVLHLPHGSALLINESYNANPTSVRAALTTLAEETARGDRVAVLGDMLELGEDGPALHAGLSDALAAVDRLYLAGPLMRHLHHAVPGSVWTEDSATLAPIVTESLADGDVVMVKGSLGSRMNRVTNALRERGR